MTAEILRVNDLQVEFPVEKGVVHAVRGASWSIREHEVLGIVGESGSGKSATALAIMGLLPAGAKVSGSVTYRNRELFGLSEKGLSTVRGDAIAMVFQDPMSSLNPVYSVGFQIAEAVRAHNSSISKPAAIERAVELLDQVGIANAGQRVGDYPHEFSGGMRQRVVIAIAMANNPELIIADEPTTALDVTIQAQVLDALRTARESTGAAAMLITHDLGVVAGQADRVVVMYAGRVVETGTVDQVFYQPRMPYTLGLLGSLPRLDLRIHQRLTPIAGAPPTLDRPITGCSFAPRCPMAQDICRDEEPDLLPTDADGHLAACHFRADLIDREPADVFVPTKFAEQIADMTSSGPVLAAERLVKHYPVRGGRLVRRSVGTLHAVCDVSFELAAGETLGLVGESGAGKSTIAKLLMSMEKPTAGAVRIHGDTVGGRRRGRSIGDGRHARRQRAHALQMVFQDPTSSLDPRMTAADLVAEPIRINGGSRRDAGARALELLTSVGLARSQADRYPHEFSGGQRQRIGIARSLALHPQVLILDEPVSALDVSVQADVVNLLEDLQDALGLSYVFIAHDLSVVRHIADRVAVLYLGRVVETGNRDDVFDHPTHPYTKALISAVPVPDPRTERVRRRTLLRGEIPSAANPPSGCRFRTRCPTFEILGETERVRCVTESPGLEDRGHGHPVACHFPEVPA